MRYIALKIQRHICEFLYISDFPSWMGNSPIEESKLPSRLSILIPDL